MKECCMRSFGEKALGDGFKLGEEGEMHTCLTCGTCHIVRGGKWREAPAGSMTANIVRTDDDIVDFGWARGIRNRKTGRIIVQCWGCGAAVEMPDRPVLEAYFEHVDPQCSLVRAILNKSKGVMPQVTHH